MITYAALVLFCSFALEQLFGEYPNRIHPVVWMGTLMGKLYQTLDHRQKNTQIFFGWVFAVLGPIILILLFLSVRSLLPHLSLQFLYDVFFLRSTFALKALGAAHNKVAKRVQGNELGGDILRELCSRDSSKLSANEIRSASISSVAENLSDSFIAPILYYFFFGIPGALAYRYINTADAMFGYKDHRRWLGQGAAIIDDLANYMSARLTALLMLFTGVFAPKSRPLRGFRTLIRDYGKTPSPNGGWPMSSMAGLLGVSLKKVGVYQLGDSMRTIDHQSMRECWKIANITGYLFVCLVLMFVQGAIF